MWYPLVRINFQGRQAYCLRCNVLLLQTHFVVFHASDVSGQLIVFAFSYGNASVKNMIVLTSSFVRRQTVDLTLMSKQTCTLNTYLFQC